MLDLSVTRAQPLLAVCSPTARKCASRSQNRRLARGAAGAAARPSARRRPAPRPRHQSIFFPLRCTSGSRTHYMTFCILECTRAFTPSPPSHHVVFPHTLLISRLSRTDVLSQPRAFITRCSNHTNYSSIPLPFRSATVCAAVPEAEVPQRPGGRPPPAPLDSVGPAPTQ